LNPLKAWIGQKTCRVRRGFSCARKKIEALAELPDHPPRLFIWRGARHRVAKADGPERVHREWWRSDSETKLIRDYYRVETTDGARYWIFRDAPAEQGGGWWLHGVGEA
jgi:protein ImuB